jgi:hypothetical protein
MYCNHCGSPIAADQAICRACGKSVAETRTAVAMRSRVAEHLHLLAIFWFVVGAISLIPVAVMLVLAGVAGSLHTADYPPVFRLAGPLIFLTIAAVLGVIALASILTGWGLLKVRPWGRMLALVMGFIALLHPPFGTALGIYTLYVLLPGPAGEEYGRMAAELENRRGASA